MEWKKRFQYLCTIMVCIAFLSGCSKGEAMEPETDDNDRRGITETAEADYADATEDRAVDEKADFSEEFDHLSGCAIIYFPDGNTYVYNQKTVDERVSPLSTFKIVSALIGLDNDVLEDGDSTMEYNGTQYSVSEWNGDLTLQEAFQTSCVWYFRKVIDKVGESGVSSTLERLHYGNCDTSEWNGSGTNPLPELNGFWLDSSLKISPREQVEVLADIFEGNAGYSRQSIQVLKNIMFIKAEGTCNIYGKTGSSTDGRAWFVGFLEKDDQRGYFAVYLDDEINEDKITGSKAKEIAVAILENEIIQTAVPETGSVSDNESDEDMRSRFYEQFYSGLSYDEIEKRVIERASYYRASSYYEEITEYWEQTRGATDISNVTEPLYYTGMKYYTVKDFENEPAIVIHLAKNEIYARHGYIFKDPDLNNYFMGCAWYQPVWGSDEFDDSVFNDYERKNLELLSSLDIK